MSPCRTLQAFGPHCVAAPASLPAAAAGPPPPPPPSCLLLAPATQEEVEALRAEQLEVEAAAAALEAELSANLRQQQRDLSDGLAAASSGVDAATLEARRRELAQVLLPLRTARGFGRRTAPQAAPEWQEGRNSLGGSVLALTQLQLPSSPAMGV